MSELGRRAGVSHALISDVLNEKAAPSANFCLSVASALDERPETLLRLAGHLPPLPPSADGEEEVLYLYRCLRPDYQRGVIVALRGLVSADHSLPTPADAECVAPSMPAPGASEPIPSSCPFADWFSESPPSDLEKLSQLCALADAEERRYIIDRVVATRRRHDRANEGGQTVRGGAVAANGQQ